jgi:hypothetical protein
LRILGSGLVRFVDDDDIADLEQAGLYRLDAVAEAGGFDHHDRFSERRDIGTVLTGANGLDQYQRVANGIEQMDEPGGRPGESTLAAATGHAPDEHTVVSMTVHHANAISQDRAAGKWA